MTVEHDSELRIVVGVDGSELSRSALSRAAFEAATHGASLDIVHAWNYLDQPGPEFDPHYGEARAPRANRRVRDRSPR